MGDRFELFQKFLVTENSEIQLEDLLLNSLLVVLYTTFLEFTYAKCARSISNRKMFAHSFLVITFTTMIIISIVKSSLALSLGLVGALSIVRFRAAIKEPEELAYLFFTIAIGLGLGAQQIVVTSAAFFILMAIIWVKHWISPSVTQRNLYLTLRGSEQEMDMIQIEELVRGHFPQKRIKRLDSAADQTEVCYLVDSKKDGTLQAFHQALSAKAPNVELTFIDVQA